MELLQHVVGWSPSEERLIFPVYSNKKLVMWTGRYFGESGTAPKYFTKGKRNDVLHVIESEVKTDSVVVVEDIVSAIVVSRVQSAVPVFGSNIPLEHARTLSERFWDLSIWLDPDMKRSSLKQALKLEPFFRSVKCIFSDKDPKCYNPAQIARYLGKCN